LRVSEDVERIAKSILLLYGRQAQTMVESTVVEVAVIFQVKAANVRQLSIVNERGVSWQGCVPLSY